MVPPKQIAFSLCRYDNGGEDTREASMTKHDRNSGIDDIELEGREDEEYVDPSKLRPVDAKTSARVMASFNADGTVRTHIRARKTDFVWA